MTNKPKNPDAFPCDNKSEGYSGMTLRDYFAAKAMQSVLSNQTFLETVLRDAQVGTLASDAVSRTAFVMADAMLKQREK
jgi:hypothetical protein